MHSPLISVIIPAYNHELFIADAISSVLAQSFTDFEIIAIDDGSTDNTFGEMKKISDPRIRLFHQMNIGAAETINRGIDLAEGRYITILNSDDLYHPERLAVFQQYMEENPDTMVLSSLVEPVDSSGNRLKSESGNAFHDYWLKWYDTAIRNLQQDDHYFFSLLQSNFVVSTSNIFLNSQIFLNESKFNPVLAYCHDYAFLLRVLQTHRFGFIHRKLVKYRLHDTNTIRHNHFLKRFEIQYAVFHSLDFTEILSNVSPLQEKMSGIVFRGLEKNPDINLGIRLSEQNRMLEKSDAWLKDLQTMVTQSEKQIACLQSLVGEKDMRIRARDEQLHRLAEKVTQMDELQIQCEKQAKLLEIKEQNEISLKSQIHHKDLHLKEVDRKIIALENTVAEKERFLQEIFNSKGWHWLTRYRNIKQNLTAKMKTAYNPQPLTDEKTYHAKVMHSRNHNRPKIIHAIANFLTGGSSRLVVDLVEHLGHKYDQEVISFFIPKPLAYAGLALHDFSGNVPEKRIEAFLKEKKAQMLHVHYWGEGDAAWYRKVFKAAENWPGVLIENVNTPVVPYSSNRIDHYVYVSEYAKNFAACEAEKSSVIYPGSNLTLFDRKGADIPDDVIGMVYRLDPDKLKENAIRVFIEVVKKRPRTQVLIVGGGTFLNAYQTQVAEEGASANFQFTGYVPYEKLPEYYEKLSVFVAPVWKESFGQVTPFAMSMKIPVAGYHIGALPEILGSDDLLSDDTGALVDIIVDLLDDRERRIEIGQKNHLRVHERFSVEAMVAAYDRVYAQLLHDRENRQALTR